MMQTLIGRKGAPGEGPFMLLVLKIDDEHIQEARFHTYPCPAAAACGQYITDYIEGKEITEIKGMEPEQITKAIGRMPLGREHCPQLATDALKDALDQLSIIDTEKLREMDAVAQ